MQKTGINVLVYFILATLVSFLFRHFSPGWLDIFRLPYGGYNGLSLLVGLGPVVGAVICSAVFGNKRLMLLFWGNSVIKSLIFLLIPIVTVIYLRVVNKEDIGSHFFALKVCGMWLVYVLGEEFGWRGYLQQLVGHNDYVRSLVVGVLWYLWHLSFIYDGYSFGKELLFMVILIAGSFVMVKVSRRTGSLATAVALHFSFSVLTNIRLPEGAAVAVVVMCFCWGVLYGFWDRGFMRRF